MNYVFYVVLLHSQFVADAGHEVEVEAEVVDGVEGGAQGLFGYEEVAEVGAGVAAADLAGAGGVDGALVVGVFEALDVHADGGAVFAGLGGAEEEAVAGGAGGEDAVHHVDAHAGVLLDLVGVADAHDVARLVAGKEFEGAGDHLAGDLARFADGEAADGVAGEVEFDEALGGFAAEVRIHAALDDAEERLGAVGEIRG
jgi:hypothetical protein